MTIIYRWARRDELERFNIPIAPLDETALASIMRHGWKRRQILTYLAEAWYVCECIDYDELPPRYDIRRAWGNP